MDALLHAFLSGKVRALRLPPGVAQAEACATQGLYASLCANVICCYADASLVTGRREQRVTGDPKRILRTGGAGFIGSHLGEAPLPKHFVLSAVDIFDNFYSL